MNHNKAITKSATPNPIKLRVNAIPLPIVGIVPLVARAIAETIIDANPAKATIGIITANTLAIRQNFLPDSNDTITPRILTVLVKG